MNVCSLNSFVDQSGVCPGFVYAVFVVIAVDACPHNLAGYRTYKDEVYDWDRPAFSKSASPGSSYLRCSFNALQISSVNITSSKCLPCILSSCIWNRTVSFVPSECLTWVLDFFSLNPRSSFWVIRLLQIFSPSFHISASLDYFATTTVAKSFGNQIIVVSFSKVSARSPLHIMVRRWKPNIESSDILAMRCIV